MKSTIEQRRGAGLAVVGAAVVTGASLGTAAAPAPAFADMPQVAGVAAVSKIDFVYATPVIAENGDKLTWRWTVSNSGDLDAFQVIVMHRLGGSMQIRRLSAGCTASGVAIRCAYGRIAPGQKRTGSVEVELSEDVQGTLQISGRVTWQQGGKATARHAAERVAH